MNAYDKRYGGGGTLMKAAIVMARLGSFWLRPGLLSCVLDDGHGWWLVMFFDRRIWSFVYLVMAMSGHWWFTTGCLTMGRSGDLVTWWWPGLEAWGPWGCVQHRGTPHASVHRSLPSPPCIYHQHNQPPTTYHHHQQPPTAYNQQTIFWGNQDLEAEVNSRVWIRWNHKYHFLRNFYLSRIVGYTPP